MPYRGVNPPGFLRVTRTRIIYIYIYVPVHLWLILDDEMKEAEVRRHTSRTLEQANCQNAAPDRSVSASQAGRQGSREEEEGSATDSKR